MFCLHNEHFMYISYLDIKLVRLWEYSIQCYGLVMTYLYETISRMTGNEFVEDKITSLYSTTDMGETWNCVSRETFNAIRASEIDVINFMEDLQYD